MFQLPPLTLIAQGLAVEMLIDRYLPVQETEVSSESLLDEIQLLFDNPINPNTSPIARVRILKRIRVEFSV